VLRGKLTHSMAKESPVLRMARRIPTQTMYRGTNKSVDLSQRSTDSMIQDQETRQGDRYVDLPDLVRLCEIYYIIEYIV